MAKIFFLHVSDIIKNNEKKKWVNSILCLPARSTENIQSNLSRKLNIFRKYWISKPIYRSVPFHYFLSVEFYFSTSNLSLCLPVEVSAGSFNNHTLSNGSPCCLDNLIGRQIECMPTLQKIGAKHFPIFTLSNMKQIKYWISLAASKSPQIKTTEPAASIKVFSTHRSTDWKEIENLPLL